MCRDVSTLQEQKRIKTEAEPDSYVATRVITYFDSP